jgi:2-polyprenyl-6-methoxyphenol hydroxylase-like FAD-dependent oxidoreductase
MGSNILISGGGVAGLTLAYWLASAGFTPVIVETSPQLRIGGYMIDFWGIGYTVAERMGLQERLREIGYDIREIRLVDGRGHRKTALTIDSMREALGDRYLSSLRGELVRELYRTLGDRAEVIFGDRVKSLTPSEQGVVAEFEQGPARRFDAVVGADGVHSSVRRLVFGADAQFEMPLGYSVAAFTADSYPHRDEGVYLSRTIPGRQIVRCTLRNGRSVFFIVVTSELTDGRSLESQGEQKSCITDAIAGTRWEEPEIAAAIERCDDFYFDSVCQIRMPAWSRGRVVLLGDAAYCPSLLAGEGASFAMAGAYILAGELASSDGQVESAFWLYEQRLKGFIERKQRAALRLGGWFAPRTRFGLLIRNELTRLAATSALSNLILRPMVADDLRLPDYPWSIGVLPGVADA